MKHKIELMLDSGAFSAWTKKINIDIEAYINFCLKNINYISYVVNLDVIPGSPGIKNISSRLREASANEGYKNYEYMLKRGIPKEKLIHVFHQGEDFKWLIKMTKEIPYIGLSPANDRGTNEKVLWLDKCMKYVLDTKGIPLIKFHGFAVTALKILLRYPWYSVDSTSWVITSRNGIISVPTKKKNKWIYDENSFKITLSIRSSKSPWYIHRLPTIKKDIVLQYIKEKGFKLGKSELRKETNPDYKPKKNELFHKKHNQVETIIEPGLCNDYKLRDQLNIIYYLDLEKSLPEWPWAFKQNKVKTGFGL